MKTKNAMQTLLWSSTIFFLTITLQNINAQTPNAMLQKSTATNLNAKQSELHYTFNKDIKVELIHELNGQLFIPAGYQQDRKEPLKLQPGDMSINILSQAIQINGVEELGSFQIVSKHRDKVGFIYEIMDALGNTARFKAVTNAKGYIILLYIYSEKLGEHTFFLADADLTNLAADKNYFTLKEDLFIRQYTNLIDKTIIPYTYRSKDSIQPIKLDPKDNLSFVFTEENIQTPQGTFKIKKSSTYEYRLKGHPSVRSMIEIDLKNRQPNKLLIFLNFKQQIELIQLGDVRYMLMQ